MKGRDHRKYEFTIGEAGSWRIGYGYSNFLVAEGSGWSRALGRSLYDGLRRPPGRALRPPAPASLNRRLTRHGR